MRTIKIKIDQFFFGNSKLRPPFLGMKIHEVQLHGDGSFTFPSNHLIVSSTVLVQAVTYELMRTTYTILNSIVTA